MPMQVTMTNGKKSDLLLYIFREYIINDNLKDLNYERMFTYTLFASSDGIYGVNFKSKDYGKVLKLAIEFRKKLPKDLRWFIFKGKHIDIFVPLVAAEMWFKENSFNN